MRCDRRRSELRLAACAASIYLVTNMTTNLLNLTHTTPFSPSGEQGHKVGIVPPI